MYGQLWQQFSAALGDFSIVSYVRKMKHPMSKEKFVAFGTPPPVGTRGPKSDGGGAVASGSIYRALSASLMLVCGKLVTQLSVNETPRVGLIARLQGEAAAAGRSCCWSCAEGGCCERGWSGACVSG